MQNFYIIDGSGFLYRAYYGLPEMTGPDGANSNVVYGFAKMMLQILMEEPTYMLIARDAPTKTKRHESFEAYKANRPKTPDDFKQQIPKIKGLIEKLGIPSYEIGGYEADDIIYTAATIAKKQEIQTTIFSSDKDLKQLLCENIIFKDPMKQTITDTQKFMIDFDFSPIHIVDYLALVGDSSDNIPGVAGIGPKGATTLIKKYETIENIYDHIQEIPESLRTKLEANKESAYMSKQLIQLMPVPTIQEDIFPTRKNNVDIQQFETLLVQERHFASLAKIIQTLKKTMQQPKQMSLFG